MLNRSYCSKYGHCRGRIKRRSLEQGLACLALLAAVGCARPPFEYPAALNSERPDQRVAGICHACDIRDETVVPILVDRLEDEDEGVRFYAILALERLTGTRLGYQYHASEPQRLRAVQRWRQHIANPTTQASGGAEK